MISLKTKGLSTSTNHLCVPVNVLVNELIQQTASDPVPGYINATAARKSSSSWWGPVYIWRSLASESKLWLTSVQLYSLNVHLRMKIIYNTAPLPLQQFKTVTEDKNKLLSRSTKVPRLLSFMSFNSLTSCHVFASQMEPESWWILTVCRVFWIREWAQASYGTWTSKLQSRQWRRTARGPWCWREMPLHPLRARCGWSRGPCLACGSSAWGNTEHS